MTQQKVNLGTLGDGKTATIYCRSVDTRYGFRHDAVMIVNGEPKFKAKACYYNRTWESYQYQSVLHNLAEIFVKAKTGVKSLFCGKTKKADRLYKNLAARIDRNRGGRRTVDERVFI